MVKAEIRSLILNELPKWDKVAKYHPRFLDAAIEKVINSMYTDVFKRSPHELQRYVKQFGYDTPIAVSTELTTGISYATLPANIVPFPDKASGVRRVATATQGGVGFYPMDAREADLVSGGSFTNTLTSRAGYIVAPGRVEFYNISVATAAEGVRMDLIIPFSVYEDTDVVLIPEENDYKGETFIDKVLKVLGVIQKIDLKDDNSDKEDKK